jgi:sucrose phosphorylase
MDNALKQPVVQAIIALARLRKHNAFNGTFAWVLNNAHQMTLGWENASDEIRLQFSTEVGSPSFVIEVVTDGVAQRFDNMEAFSNY